MHPEFQRFTEETRRGLPAPVYLAELAPVEREQVLDGRAPVFAALRTERRKTKVRKAGVRLLDELRIQEKVEAIHLRGVRAPAGLARPGGQAFVAHARKFGADGVLDTARAMLNPDDLAALEAELLLVDGPSRKRRRRTTGDMEAQVRALADRGMVPTAIANALNISDRRCRQLLRKARPPENGGHKPFVQAEKNVDKASRRPKPLGNALSTPNRAFLPGGQLTVYDLLEGAPTG